MTSTHPSSPSPLAELQAHLKTVVDAPSTTLDLDILSQAGLYLSTPEYVKNGSQESSPIFWQIAQVLPVLQQDPEPLIRLVQKVIAPLSSDHILNLDLTPALSLDAKVFHDMALDLLWKATVNAVSAEKLAAKPELIGSIVRIWLCTDNTGTSCRAGNLLLDLLSVSKNAPECLQTKESKRYGRGAVWKRLFEDGDIYRLLFTYCGVLNPLANESPKLSKKDKTIAQARLMEWLPKVGALDWDAITESQVRNVEKEAGLQEGQGLMDFAATKMVDLEDDILMGIGLIGFYSDLIATVKHMALTDVTTSVSLKYLIDRDLHFLAMDYWLRPDRYTSMEHTFLAGSSANYLAQYLSHYPDYLEKSNLSQAIHGRLMSTLDLSPHQWSHGKSPRHELHVLSSLPRTVLVNSEGIGNTPISKLPFKTTNPDVLDTLATIFHGPLPQEERTTLNHRTLDVSISHARHSAEQSAARMLFTQYLVFSPDIFMTLVNQAQTLALEENALASINFIKAIATANWPTSSADTEPAIEATHESGPEPMISGTQVLLTHPSIVPHLLFFLLKPSPSHSGVISHRNPDAKSTAHAVASAKFDLIQVIESRLQCLLAEMRVQDTTKERLMRIDPQLKRRLAEGIWGKGANIGGNIATLEM